MLAPRAASTSSSEPTPGAVKKRLAAIRELFDWLIFGQVLGVNPTAAVLGPRALVTSGQAPVQPSRCPCCSTAPGRHATTQTPGVDRGETHGSRQQQALPPNRLRHEPRSENPLLDDKGENRPTRRQPGRKGALTGGETGVVLDRQQRPRSEADG
jgi:hypothetical protein